MTFVAAFRLLRRPNRSSGRNLSHVRWFPWCEQSLSSFLTSWLRRSVGFARGWYTGVVHNSQAHRRLASAQIRPVNWGPLSLSIRLGYPYRETTCSSRSRGTCSWCITDPKGEGFHPAGKQIGDHHDMGVTLARSGIRSHKILRDRLPCSPGRSRSLSRWPLAVHWQIHRWQPVT